MPAMPMREDDLQRPRARRGGDPQPVRKGLMREVTIPDPDPDWDPQALNLYTALAESGQADFYQQSDWAFAWMLCEELSVYKRLTWKGSGDVKRSPEMLKALLQGMERLLVTEGDRRRLKVELEEPPEDTEPADLVYIKGLRDEMELDET